MKSSTAGDMIKGGGVINREIRVGVTHAYIEFVKCMGGLWLERNISLFLNHIVDLVASPKATPTHVDAVYARKCVLFILRSLIGSLLGEKAQISAAKEICHIIIKQMNTVGVYCFEYFSECMKTEPIEKTLSSSSLTNIKKLSIIFCLTNVVTSSHIVFNIKHSIEKKTMDVTIAMFRNSCNY